MPDKIIKVAIFNNYMKAHLAKQALDNAGIRNTLAEAFEENHFGSELLVFESESAKAVEILKDTNLFKDASDCRIII